MKPWQNKLHEIIYEADTPSGKLFDVVLLILIVFSVILVILESVAELNAKYGTFFNVSEWIITIVFTLEYIARLISVKDKSKYVFSFYGVIDFISTIPKYLSLFFVGTQALIALRSLRLLRVFRILKLTRYLSESQKLSKALAASKRKISVFLFVISLVCVILGTIMYMVESPEAGFTSIPKSIYWAIVTLTTVGYGDIAPMTVLGQTIASVIMIMGYSIIAIPTGIVTAELTKADVSTLNNSQVCRHCTAGKHHDKALFCWRCGHDLHPEKRHIE
ncbi:MAG: ion transporter [Candidatus Kapaibacteriales bacterium]